ncbi:hypothetical protein RUM43_013349 [Polyplax serrata]|uniref:Uncharacterized protein n=1 Tax=Polyplax serrata TaxID=468196 RepID=A0AAN8S707_POLSC
MADIARAALVSKDSHRGLLTEETLKNGHSDGSNSLTECSVTNHTNSCSIQNCLYDGKEDYQEIDSFSDLSFHTTDEISLQDILESEFAARISNINAMEKSRDSFDDLFEDYCRTDSEVTHETSVKQKCNSSKIKDSSHFHQELMAFGSNDEPVDNPDTGVIENFDDFISGPMQENTFLITDCLQECVDLRQQEQPNEVDHLHRNSLTSVNVFKSDDPEIMPVLTNFDPFTAVEEDSDCSNPTTNSNVLNSPEEFPFPVSPGDESDYLVGIGESTATPLTETTEKENSIAEINRTDDAMRELFTKRVSDDNSDDLTGQNYEGDEDELKLEVKTAARDMGTVDTFPNVTSLLTPDSVEVDEFFSSEDIFKTDKVDTRTGAIENGHTRITCDHFDVEPAAAFFCDTHDEQWTTVGEVLKAQPENFELDEDDPPAAECKNVCTKKSVSSVTVNNTNDTSDVTTLYENGVSETDSEVSTTRFPFRCLTCISQYSYRNLTP